MQFPKSLVVGAPRTGFALLINVCTSILREHQLINARPPDDVVNVALVHLATAYIKQRYQQAFRDHGVEQDVVFNGEFHLLVGGPKWLDRDDPTRACVRKYVGLRGDGDFLLVTRHPRKAMEFYPVLHSHVDPRIWLETPYYDEYIKLTSIRNPIGVINSASFSINAMASEYIQRFMGGADEEPIRQRLGLYKLTDMTFVQGLVTYLKKCIEEFIDTRDQYHVMRWEDLISDPVPTIKAVGQALGIPLSDATAQAIWTPMDHQNLMLHHKHNYRRGKGIVGDWKNSLVNEHMELFRDNDFGQYLEALGYPPIPQLNPRDYSPFQRLVTRHIQRKEIFSNTGDQDLFGFAFNKSNIDASKYNFKSFPPKKWTHVERSTIDDDSVVVGISDAVEDACCKINELIERGASVDLRDRAAARAEVARLQRDSAAMVRDCGSPQVTQLQQHLFSAINGVLDGAPGQHSARG